MAGSAKRDDAYKFRLALTRRVQYDRLRTTQPGQSAFSKEVMSHDSAAYQSRGTI